MLLNNTEKKNKRIAMDKLKNGTIDNNFDILKANEFWNFEMLHRLVSETF